MANKYLNKAKKDKNDEFYTLYEDIAKEMQYYDLRGKKIYLPCDTQDSMFWKYFIDNGYDVSRSSMYDYQYSGQEPVLCYNSFDSEQSKRMLEECDVVITNPPFSRFRDFYELIRDKKFVIVCPVTAFTYSIVKPDTMHYRVWYGRSVLNRFINPKGETVCMNNLAWMTNYGEIPKHEYKFTCKLDDTYRYLDGQDILNINKSKLYPDDYYDRVAVPITFLRYFDYDTFEIVGWCDKNFRNEGFICTPYIDGRELFKRVVVKRKQS